MIPARICQFTGNQEDAVYAVLKRNHINPDGIVPTTAAPKGAPASFSAAVKLAPKQQGPKKTATATPKTAAAKKTAIPTAGPSDLAPTTAHLTTTLQENRKRRREEQDDLATLEEATGMETDIPVDIRRAEKNQSINVKGQRWKQLSKALNEAGIVVDKATTTKNDISLLMKSSADFRARTKLRATTKELGKPPAVVLHVHAAGGQEAKRGH
ncbi:hypothetical protein HUJ04_010999 [Dendroctonus ponderosae]|nr:hypothetical protein HUJ04_010999 [Dendroctonus ponderosae]